MAAATVSANAAANVQITEIMYTGLFGEFVEITNVGDASQNMSGWEFSDSRRGVTHTGSVVPGTPATSTDLSGIGTLDAGEVAIITEVSDVIFIQAWYTEAAAALPVGFTGIPGANIVQTAINLGRADEVNIYASGDLDGSTAWDRMTYTDQGSGVNTGPRSEDVSAVPISNDTTTFFEDWTLSLVSGIAWKAGLQGDIQGNPIPGPVGSPGVFPNL
ncbi:lamin tail domain-containing protein [Luteolibacter sp. Populi]|uniref:lamin tail domain-containing protein n=1 Tax=Luteolibacter sp. Populi TaxID=3230487 RepID=UPI0034670CCC